jgi:hypothetical protein
MWCQQTFLKPWVSRQNDVKIKSLLKTLLQTIEKAKIDMQEEGRV